MRRLGVIAFCLCAATAPVRAQQTLIGGFSGTTGPCNNAGPGSFGGSLTAVVQPSLSSLAAAGGSFTGSESGTGVSNDCGKIHAIGVTLTITGTVSAGGSVSLTFTGTGSGGGGGGGASLSGSGAGTTSSTGTTLSGTFTVTDSSGNVSTGSFTLASLSTATLTGSFTAGGLEYCNQTTEGQFTASALVVVNTQPALSSLATSGGTFQGSLSGGGTSNETCNPTMGFTVNGSISGTVSPGGSVSWMFTLTPVDSHGHGSPITGSGSGNTSMLVANGTVYDPTQDPAPTSYSIVLSAAGSQATLPPIQVPGGGGSSQITLAGGNVGAAYALNLPVSGGTAPYSWMVAGGALPAGLTLSGTGFLSGTPTQAGGAIFTATVTDSAGAMASSSFALTIAPQLVTITTSSFPNGSVGSPYPAQILTASGGTAPYTFQITGALPAGLTFSNGTISGTPTAAGTSSITVGVTDSSSPAQTASVQITIGIAPSGATLVVSQSAVTFTLPNGASVLPAAVRVGVQSSAASQMIGYTVAVSPAVPWLIVQSGTSTPGAVNLSLTPQAFSVTASAQTSVVVTCAQSSPCAGSAQKIGVSLTLVTAAPQLVVTTPSLAFTASSSNPQPVSQGLGLQNTGGGQIFINSIAPANGFVTVTGNPISLEGGPPSYLIVTVDPSTLKPGFQQSSISIVTSAGSLTVPVTVLVSASATMTLNPAGTIFNAQAGSLPGNANGSFQVSITGGSNVSFTAAVLPGASWLTLNTPNGTSTPANPGLVNFTINSSATSLAAGAYYGAIQVSSPNVADSPQTYIVVLNIVSTVTAVTPNPQPAGLLFIASSGTPPAQTVKVFAGTAAALPYQAASDSSWLTVTPATGNTSSASPASTSVSVNLSGLKAGVYAGGVSYSLPGAGVRTVNVTLIVETGAVTSSGRTGPAPLATTSCVPAKLVPTENGLVNTFSQPAAWPTPLAVLLVNDCGQPVTNAQVVASFSNGDPPLALSAADTTTGNYSATWTPRNNAQQIAITVTASAKNFPTASAQIAGQITPNAAPILTSNGTLNAFAIVAEPGVPFAPGTIVQIYGSNLASKAASGGIIPLPTSINQSSVIIGGITAPLYYASPGQINAQIPFELTAGNPYQLIVNANGALSTPYPIQLVADSPGIAQFAGGGIIAQHLNYSLVTETSPAAPGEYITIYVAGMGLTNQTVPSGTASPQANVLDAVTLTLGGAPVTNVLYAGLTPTVVGLYQINLQVPAGVTNGDLQLVLTQASGVSNSTVLPVHNQ